jgi:hypothetical protein
LPALGGPFSKGHLEMSTLHPYYRRPVRSPGRTSSAFSSCGDHVDLSNAHLPPYPADDAVPEARDLFDARAAASVADAVAIAGDNFKTADGEVAHGPVRIWPPVEWVDFGTLNTFSGYPKQPWSWPRDLLELKYYGNAPTIYLPLAKCLSALAYLDFFPEQPRTGSGLRSMVSASVLAASPGWCGTFGPGVDGTTSLGASEGNYDMSEMHLVAMAYQYYDALSPDAREYLITSLLACGRIHRPNCDDTFTSGLVPDDWERAGYISPLGDHYDIGESENHILMIATARYLTNQLLFQRDRSSDHDNRRNGGGDWPSCTSLILDLLHRILRDDFSEYNSKDYQEETRWALLNLCTFAYDDEVRLGARMVLDYLSAHMAVSSNDLRRMLPFRRRAEEPYIAHDPSGFMTVGLLDAPGPDPMPPYFAMQAGNTRAYESGKPWRWGINNNPGTSLAIEVLSDYRLPASVYDLFVNDQHRRFFQRLHRTSRDDEIGGNRNADNMEIYAGSPSYLITAGGSPSGYAVAPMYIANIPLGPVGQEVGVAVTTSFMPTGFATNAADLIQFGTFLAGDHVTSDYSHYANYGVAPDFACGFNLHLPNWVKTANQHGNFLFVNQSRNDPTNGPGFYLAIYQAGPLALLEAYDTWLHPGLKFSEFVQGVISRNSAISLADSQQFEYTTTNGNRLTAVIGLRSWELFGAEVLSVTYGHGDPTDAIGDAGNITDRFLNGTVMTSPAEAVVQIANPFLGTTVTLDMSDPWNPRRTDEHGAIEQAGSNHEVWLDFQWTGPSEGDVFRPFTSLSTATTAVAEGGVVRIIPGTTTDRSTINGNKSLRLVAPIGGVIIGARDGAQRQPIAGTSEPADPVHKDDVWVQFCFPVVSQPQTSEIHIAGPFNNLTDAQAAVADGDTIRIVPGITTDRPTLGNGKRFKLEAPIGGVTIGAPQTAPLPPSEVWVNFDWSDLSDGQFCNPFKTIAAAAAAVAPGGIINIMSGATTDRSTIGVGKPFRLVAPSGAVTIGT